MSTESKILPSNEIELDDLVSREKRENSFYDNLKDDQIKIKSNNDEDEKLEDLPLLSNQEQASEPAKVHNSNQSEILQSTNFDLDDITEETNFIENNNHNSIDQVTPAERSNRLSQLVDHFRDESVFNFLKPTKLKLLYLLSIVTILFLVLFLPNCLNSLDYDKVALSRNRWTGYVNDQIIYKPGLHFLLPWKHWLIFEKTVQEIKIEKLSIFTSDKLSVTASFAIYYYININQLGNIYRKYGLMNDFKPLIRKVILSEILNGGQKFAIEDFRSNRISIKNHLKEIVSLKLNNEYSVVLFDLYMNDLTFTSEINNLNLLRVVNNIHNEKSEHEKTTNSIKFETNFKVEVIKNQEKLVLTTAELNATHDKIKRGKIDFDYKIELTHLKSLNNSLSALDFYQADKLNTNRQYISKRILSFFYLSSLINNPNVIVFSKNIESLY